MGYSACVLALLVSYLFGKRSRIAGIIVVIGWGYSYGIMRAYMPGAASHFIFDAAVFGLYISQVQSLTRPFFTPDGVRLRHWIILLMGWPTLLFFVPVQDTLIQLAGLRSCIFLLPFVLLGAQLTRDDLYKLCLWLSTFNIAAFTLAILEFTLGVDKFYPRNAVTELIFHSNDVGVGNFTRIPASFVSSHVFGATMVLTLALIIGAWVQNHKTIRHRQLLLAGLITSILSVFLSATRTGFVLLFVLFLVFTLSNRVRVIHRVGWVVILAIISYVVVNEERLQRFTTLQDSDSVSERVKGSVNEQFFQAVVDYPFGNGLGGGGTSLPFFLATRVQYPVFIENEYARIVLETGIIGLTIWIGYVVWVFMRPPAGRDEPWFLGRRMARSACLAMFISAMLGVGLFTSIPQTTLLFLMMGWVSVPQNAEVEAQERNFARVTAWRNSLRRPIQAR